MPADHFLRGDAPGVFPILPFRANVLQNGKAAIKGLDTMRRERRRDQFLHLGVSIGAGHTCHHEEGRKNQHVSYSQPVLRQHAYMFAVRSIRVGGLFRAEYERLLAHGKATTKKKAVVAVSRSGLKLLWSIARDQRRFTPDPPEHRRAPVPA